MFVKKAIDINTGKIRIYKEGIEQEKQFDFVFTKNRRWYYKSSSNNQALFTSSRYGLEKIVGEGERWAIIDVKTGEIIKNSEGTFTTRQKILFCYPHLITRSISKILGINKIYVYETLRKAGLPIIKPAYSSNNKHKVDKWSKI